jgi:hypothetical protein
MPPGTPASINARWRGIPRARSAASGEIADTVGVAKILKRLAAG